MKKITFKQKIMVMVFAIVTVTTITSYLSVNYHISRYLYQKEIDNMNRQFGLIENMLIRKIDSTILLAESLNFNLSTISSTQEKTGFYKVVKIISGLVITEEGSVTSGKQNSNIINTFAQANGKVTISDVTFDKEVPLLSITVPRGENSGDIFYVDLSQIQQLLRNSSLPGSYLELRDPTNQVLFSNKLKAVDSNLLKQSSPFSIRGKKWTLISYIDNDYIQENTSILNNAITLTLMATALLILPLCGMAIKAAYTPIISLRNLVVNLSSGDIDLSQRLEVQSKDELGQIATGINEFTHQLQKMVLGISEGSLHIRKEVEQISHQSESNFGLLTAHSEEAAQVSVAVSELNTAAASVAKGAAHVDTLTQSTLEEAEHSKIIVRSAVNTVSALADEVAVMSKSVMTMNKDTAEISSLLSVIGEIAEQTNLLALNAAIEAARAGEQGRGFAVVADEVRALAARTQHSTGDITAMLSRLNQGTRNVVTAMDATKTSCKRTSEETKKVMFSLETMTDSIASVGDLTTQMASSAEQQNQVTNEIKGNMETITGMIEYIHQNGQNTLSSVKQLTLSNQQLQTIVARFRLN